jgi:hypothetical protein
LGPRDDPHARERRIPASPPTGMAGLGPHNNLALFGKLIDGNDHPQNSLFPKPFPPSQPGPISRLIWRSWANNDALPSPPPARPPPPDLPAGPGRPVNCQTNLASAPGPRPALLKTRQKVPGERGEGRSLPWIRPLPTCASWLIRTRQRSAASPFAESRLWGPSHARRVDAPLSCPQVWFELESPTERPVEGQERSRRFH